MQVKAGDQILFVTAGSGGWGDPLDREAEKVQLDVERGLVSLQKAKDSYGVILQSETLELDRPLTEELRSRMRNSRDHLSLFNFGNRETVIPTNK